MAYRWQYEDATGAIVNGPGDEFEDRDTAEAWLGENWSELLDVGIDQVTLLDGGQRAYGPMSLHPPQP